MPMTAKGAWLLLMLASFLAGCERQERPPAQDQSADEIAETAPPTPVDPLAGNDDAPLLGAIAQIDIEAELEPGVGCHAEQDGKNLLTAVDGDAIAKPYGTLRHFDYDGDLAALGEGGVFTAGAITIAVVPEEGEGEQIGEVRVREAEIVFSEEGQPASQTIDATWQCRA